MSNEASTPVATSTPAVSEPTSPTGLTGAPAAVYTALVASPGTTAADIALAAGVPIHVVQLRLGHESIKTTVDTYGHLMPDAQAAAAAAAELALGKLALG